MSDVVCFWVEDSGFAEISFRRYYYYTDMPEIEHKCDVTVPIGRQSVERDDDGYLKSLKPADYQYDERWPKSCPECGRDFGLLTNLDGVGRSNVKMSTQVNQESIYRRVDTGEEWGMRHLPPGAMFDAIWSRHWGVGEDGISLTVVCPYTGNDARGSMWHVDGPASGSGRELIKNAWTRTGDPKNPSTLTVRPSILMSHYHGFLTNGILASC